jgi:hypothetical protein
VRFFVLQYLYFGDWLVPDGQLTMFCPFLIVDNPWSAFSGRDVLGYPKLLGNFGPFSQQKPYTTISTLAFAPGQPKASLQPVVKIDRSQAGAPRPRGNWPWGDLDFNRLRPAHQPLEKSLVYEAGILPTVQMKQFRDAEDPENACYQAILESETLIESISDMGELPPTQVTIMDYPGEDYPGLDLAASLGIESGKPLQPISQYYLECSFNFGDVVTLFVNT